MGYGNQLRNAACASAIMLTVAGLGGSARGDVSAANDAGAALVPDALTLIDPPAGAVIPNMLQASIVNPAQAANENRPTSRNAEPARVHTWELPPITVVGERPPEFREEERVGSYAQPRWTTDRRFSETRVYVIPEGKIEFEYWFIPTANRHGPSDIKHQFEVEMGLPYRFQVDLYLIPDRQGSAGKTNLSNSVEVRWAFADWNKIWGNPTLYVEYTFGDNNPDLIETKLLLGGEIAPRWHWGADFSFEHALGGDFSNSYEFTSGVSYTVIDEKFSVGIEEKANVTDFHNRRGAFTDNIFIGPSLQYRPLPQVHIDFAPLIGVTHESPSLQAFVILGWEF
jgi:hypothetical protein